MLQIARQPVPRRPATSVESGETAYVFASCIAFSDMARSVPVAQLIDNAMPVPTSAVRWHSPVYESTHGPMSSTQFCADGTSTISPRSVSAVPPSE